MTEEGGKFARIVETILGVGGDGFNRLSREVVVGNVILPIPDLVFNTIAGWEFACNEINSAHEKAVSEAVRKAKEEMSKTLKEVKELLPDPCVHFAFHGAIMETIDDAIRSIE